MSKACSVTCSFEGRDDSCMERINWAIKNTFFQYPWPHSCTAAQRMVKCQCPSCWACTADEAGCKNSNNAEWPYHHTKWKSPLCSSGVWFQQGLRYRGKGQPMSAFRDAMEKYGTWLCNA